MRVKRLGLVLVLLVFVLTACAGQTPTVQKYQALTVAADLRLAVLQGAGDYYSMGLLDEGTKDKIIEIDKYVQEAGKLATSALNEIRLLEQLQAMDPEAVTPEQYAAAVQAYQNAKLQLRAKWRKLTLLVDPWLMKWIQEAAQK